MKDEKRKEGQICYLTKEEMNDPHRVLQEFKDDVSIEAARKLIVAMRDVCSTTENIPYGDPKAREDLFYMTDKIIRFFEASYIQLGRITVQMNMGYYDTRYLTVFEKFGPRNLQGPPNRMPCISLYGYWLSEIGFNPGNNITVVSGPQQIFITSTKEWDERTRNAQKRA
ncbi:MAG TPA: hypothetical protein VHE34_00920 [Puia sp.]|uniref:hypothetical protein n=1 Tax=Puia sp. TaxID=2045100 RepID=UPI002D077861|nr:hypothetical protein [Puia sp.]HVU93746.1 hypothetical protein [Puia sp.]